MASTSLAPNRSGHINSPLRSSSSTAASASRGRPFSTSGMPSSSRPRGSFHPSDVEQWRRQSYSIGIIRWHQSSSPDRIVPLTSAS